MTALVVDSSDLMRFILRRILSMRGFEVREACDAPEARTLLAHITAADVVLLDWNPADSEGLQLVADLRRQTSFQPLVIIMLAAEPGRRVIQAALDAGANDYLVKPFNSMQISKKLASAGLPA